MNKTTARTARQPTYRAISERVPIFHIGSACRLFGPLSSGIFLEAYLKVSLRGTYGFAACGTGTCATSRVDAVAKPLRVPSANS